MAVFGGTTHSQLTRDDDRVEGRQDLENFKTNQIVWVPILLD